MSYQLRILEVEDGWSVVKVTGDQQAPLAIGGRDVYAERGDLVALIEARGLHVWADGSVLQEAEPEVVVEETPAPAKAPRKPRKKAGEVDEGLTEEQKRARAEYAKKYRQTMTDEQRERARERARERQKKWRETHPDKASAYAKRSSERRKERYNTDPEFRAEYREQQRGYAQTRRASDPQ